MGDLSSVAPASDPARAVGLARLQALAALPSLSAAQVREVEALSASLGVPGWIVSVDLNAWQRGRPGSSYRRIGGAG